MSETIVNEKNVEWITMEALPGVSGKLLAVDSESKSHAFLVKYAPGTNFPRHQHTCLEQIYILDGEVECDGQVYGSGTHLIFPAGQEHGPFYNKETLTELVVFQGLSGLEEAIPEIKILFEDRGVI